MSVAGTGQDGDAVTKAGWTLRDATAAEIADWDALVLRNPDGGQWTQSSAYATVKRTERLHPRHLVLEGPERVHALALEHRSLAGRFWYFATGPGASFEQRKAKASSSSSLSPIRPAATRSRRAKERFSRARYRFRWS